MHISVIIPTCNRNDLLSKCLNQLSPSTQRIDKVKYEVIVTDDSNNNGAKLFIEENYSWVKWVKGPKRGPAANRNNGAKVANGEWLIFLDDDCIPDKDILLGYYDLIKSNDKSTVIEGLIYSDENVSPLFTAPINLKGGHLWSCNFAIKKDVFECVNGFDENYKYPNLEDNDLLKRLLANNFTVVFNDKARVYHPPRRIASAKKLAKYHESWMYFYDKFGETKTIKDLLFTITKTRLNSIRCNPKGLSSIKAFFYLFEELFYTIIYSRKWK